MAMNKVKHDRDFCLKYEDKVWIVDIAEWRGAAGEGELRCYRVEGDVTTPLLAEALQNEADSRGLAALMRLNR